MIGLSRPLVLVLVLVLVLGPAYAQDAWPKAAEQRYQEATALSQKGEYAKAAAAYRAVADWPEGGAFKERAQALFCSGLQLESAKEYEKALATFREVVARFPQDRFARTAQEYVDRLDPPGAHGIEFRRRFNEVPWDALLAKDDGHGHGGHPEDHRAEVAKALSLLEALLKEHREHPQACDVALAIGDARTRLGDLEGARDALVESVSLAKREAAKSGATDPAKAGNVVNAELRLAEAKRAIVRRWLDRMAKVVLVLALGVFVSVRPWRVSPKPVLKLARALVGVDLGLAFAAVVLAEYVRRYIDDHSPLDDSAAALLVLLPGLTGIVVALGIANAVRTRRGSILAGLSGTASGAAVAVMLVYAYGLFPFLDSEL